MPLEAEENSAHAQELEANCSLQHAKSQNAARMLIATGRHTVVYGTRGKKRKKSWIFIILKKKIIIGNLFSNVDFLIITKNSGGFAAMSMALIYSHIDTDTKRINPSSIPSTIFNPSYENSCMCKRYTKCTCF